MDDTWATTHRARRDGRAPTSERVVAHGPHGPWKTTPFLAAWRLSGVTAPLVVDGPIHGALFRQDVRACLCPTLTPGAIGILATLASPQGDDITEAWAAVGAARRSLPPDSLDLNSIAPYGATLQAALRARAERSVEALWSASGILYDAVTALHCNHFFYKAAYAVRKL